MGAQFRREFVHEYAGRFLKRFPSFRRAREEAEIIEDESVQLVPTAGIPDERGPLGIRVMRHGKDFVSDKPAFTSLDVLDEARTVQRETGRIYAIDYSERTRNRAVLKAGELVAGGAIGRRTLATRWCAEMAGPAISGQYVDCSNVETPYGRQLLDDVRNRTETAMPQAHAFLVAELALRAELQAQRVGPRAPLGVR